ncbi:MAG: bifunctional hydroxymethylpyrimidine kinase/phosphomethylpyrimidine kinase [Acidobacteriota bacterium]|nr:bifunctional hydroxymethylpyrimidine kinase/phosphomethylpyrimidine kinase [Acidobacteriota bacterium]
MLVALSIAGFDPSGGAGVLADIKTFAAFGVYGTAAITSLTSQNTVAVYGTFPQPTGVLDAQLEPLFADFQIAAVKIGMLPTRETIEIVAGAIERHQLPNVVIDTVIRSTSGYDLIDDGAVEVLIERLLPLARVITPNLAEAERLTGLQIKDVESMKSAAQQIRERAQSAIRNPNSEILAAIPAVLVKGGHLSAEVIDVLYDGRQFHLFRASKILTRNTHGTGCTLSSAIAALLARGCDVPEAVRKAKSYVEAALSSAPGLGHGAGPLNHSISVETL